MSNGKKNAQSGGAGKAPRARNKTVMLTAEMAGEMRDKLSQGVNQSGGTQEIDKHSLEQAKQSIKKFSGDSLGSNATPGSIFDTPSEPAAPGANAGKDLFAQPSGNFGGKANAGAAESLNPMHKAEEPIAPVKNEPTKLVPPLQPPAAKPKLTPAPVSNPEPSRLDAQVPEPVKPAEPKVEAQKAKPPQLEIPDKPAKIQPPKIEPPKAEPPKIEIPKVEPAKETKKSKSVEKEQAKAVKSAAAKVAPAPSQPAAASAQEVDSNDDYIYYSKESKLCGFLVSYDRDANGEVYYLRSGRLIVSSEKAGSGNIMYINDDSVSPMHAVIKVTSKGNNQILDQLSENGTRIERADGEVVELSGDKAELLHGDVLVFGNRNFSVCLVEGKKEGK